MALEGNRKEEVGVVANDATSVDYANLIRRYTQNTFGVTLVKTQVLKILYIIYGMYLAQTDKPLFTGDQLQAWPYGPVFPRVYRLFEDKPGILSKKALDSINENKIAVSIIKEVVSKRYSWSAYQLSLWSHQYGGPWYDTVYAKPGEAQWGADISDDLVKSYFRSFTL